MNREPSKQIADGSDIMLDLSAGGANYNAFGFQVTQKMAAMGYSVGSATTQDYHLRQDRARLVNMSRALYRDNWLYQAIINTFLDSVIGPVGFLFEARTGIPGVDDKIEQELYPPFFQNPELRGLMDWPQLQRMALADELLTGDTLFNLLGTNSGPADAGKLQHIESERIAFNGGMDGGNKVEQGVVLNKAGQVLGFRIASVSDGGMVQSSDSQFLPADSALYAISMLNRSSQTRGLPHLISSMPNAHRLEDILTSEAIAWQVMSRFSFAHYTDRKNQRPPVRRDKNATEREGAGESDMAPIITEIGYALAVMARTGDKIEGIGQNRPAPDFEKAVATFVRLFCAPIGIPPEEVLNSWLNYNYSSARIAKLKAFLTWRIWQQHRIRCFYAPLHFWKIGRWMAEGKLVWRPTIFKHAWIPPSWPWIDEDKEMSAWAAKIDRCISTQGEALMSLGRDVQEVRAERKAEIMDAWKLAREIEEETLGQVKTTEIWRHLAGFAQGKTESAVRAGAGRNDEKTPTADDESDDSETGDEK